MNAPIRPYPGQIAELCIALAHRWEPERIFVVLTAYLDESGTHDGSPVTVMGGMLANALQWTRFEQAFGLIKKRHGFKIFHTKKFKRRGVTLGVGRMSNVRRSWPNLHKLPAMPSPKA